MRQSGRLVASIEKGADRSHLFAPGCKFWTRTVPMSATILGIVDNREQSVPGREVHVALVVLCCKLPTDQSQVRHGRMEVEGDIVVGIGFSSDKVLEGVVVHSITKLSRQYVEERRRSGACVWCGGF